MKSILGEPSSVSLKVLASADLKERKIESRFLYMSAKDTLEKTSKLLKGDHVGYALFDEKCCLLRLFGSPDFLSWCEQRSIKIGTDWREEEIGATAISVGMDRRCDFTTAGEENFAAFLHDTVIHFSVVQLESILGKYTLLGGIAIICSPGCDSDVYPALCAANAREISLMSFWHKSSIIYSNIGDEAMVSLDQSKNRNQIILNNDQIFWPFDIAPTDLSFTYLEDIVAPLPANKGFWDVVNNRRVVKDMPIRLVTKWGSATVSTSSSPFHEDAFHFKGITLTFQSSTRIKDIINKFSSHRPSFTFDNIICQDPHFYDAIQYARAASTTETNVLIFGESGTGKDVVAQAIHNESLRKDGPFVALNCAAFSKELIASEIFGYEEGAFTGAKKGGAIGKFELANQGTLFLDEIGDMPLDLQATLLRVIENQSFLKVGGNTEIKVNVRIIAATNQNLFEKIQQRLFREDLFYRLGVIRVNIPPLRDRIDDIIPLSEYFIETICKRIGKEKFILSDNARNFLETYHWPGNVRELKNMYEGILNIYDGPEITYEQVAHYLKTNSGYSFGSRQIGPQFPVGRIPPKQLSKADILLALQECQGNKVDTANHLGISRRTLYRKLVEFNLL